MVCDANQWRQRAAALMTVQQRAWGQAFRARVLFLWSARSARSRGSAEARKISCAASRRLSFGAVSAVGLDWLHLWNVQMPILYGASALSLLALAFSAWRHRQPLPLVLGAASVGILLYPLHEGLDVTVFRVLLNTGAAGLLGAAVWNAVLLRRGARPASSMATRRTRDPSRLRLWSLLATGVLIASASPAAAFMHQTSKIRFVEYSPAVFEV